MAAFCRSNLCQERPPAKAHASERGASERRASERGASERGATASDAILAALPNRTGTPPLEEPATAHPRGPCRVLPPMTCGAAEKSARQVSQRLRRAVCQRTIIAGPAGRPKQAARGPAKPASTIKAYQAPSRRILLRPCGGNGRLRRRGRRNHRGRLLRGCRPRRLGIAAAAPGDTQSAAEKRRGQHQPGTGIESVHVIALSPWRQALPGSARRSENYCVWVVVVVCFVVVETAGGGGG
jgi:hypothetical protein